MCTQEVSSIECGSSLQGLISWGNGRIPDASAVCFISGRCVRVICALVGGLVRSALCPEWILNALIKATRARISSLEMQLTVVSSTRRHYTTALWARGALSLSATKPGSVSSLAYTRFLWVCFMVFAKATLILFVLSRIRVQNAILLHQFPPSVRPMSILLPSVLLPKIQS